MSSPGVTITAGPSDWQIIQRNREGLGEIVVSGTFVTNAADFTIQVRVVDENMNTTVLPRLDWQDAETDPAAGKRLLARTGIPVGLIPTALGGSRIEQWVREDGSYGSLLLNMEEMIRKAGGEIAGILWYQGESDALGPTADDRIGRYPHRFRSLLEAFRTAAGKSGTELLVFTAQLGAYTAPDAPDPQWSRMREIQRRIAHEEQVELIVTVDCPLSDEIHISSSGNVLVGERFADAALERIHGTPTAYRYPEPVSFTAEGEANDALLLRFANVHGDWTATRHPSDITVQDAAGSVPIEQYEWPGGTDILLRLGRSLSGEVTVHGLYGASPRPTLFDDDGRCLTPFSWTIGAVSEQSV